MATVSTECNKWFYFMWGAIGFIIGCCICSVIRALSSTDPSNSPQPDLSNCPPFDLSKCPQQTQCPLTKATHIIGQKVRISLNGNYLHITEMEIFDDTGSLLSSNKPVVSKNPLWQDNSPAGLAKLTDGKYSNFVHTNNGDEYIVVDLGQMSRIGKIVIYNRVDCCKNRIKTATVSILDQTDSPVFTSSPIQYGSNVFVLRAPFESGNPPEYYPNADV